MILILSHQQLDPAPDPVVEWLLDCGADLLRLGHEDLTAPGRRWNIDVHRGDVELDGRSLLDEVSVVWCRRLPESGPGADPAGRFGLPRPGDTGQDASTLAHYLFRLLRHKPWLPDHPAHTQANNRLFMLHLAHQCGLRVPNSKVTNTRETAAAFYHAHHGRVVSKPLTGGNAPLAADAAYTGGPLRFDAARLAGLPEQFFPLLLQEAITPRYELRVFYLDGGCYATALLGNYQPAPNGYADVQPRLQPEQPALIVEYELPEPLRQRLVAFMQLAGLSTGSLDLVLADNGEYVFLGVNPMGDYLEPSSRRHFYLEEKIARWLMHQDHIHCHVG